MKKKNIILLMILLLLLMVSCSKPDEAMNNNEELVNLIEDSKDFNNNEDTDIVVSHSKDELLVNETGEIYLYGELHGKKVINDKEIELWKQYYHDEGMRHLFIEWPYFTAEFLNIRRQ